MRPLLFYKGGKSMKALIGLLIIIGLIISGLIDYF